MNRVEPLFSVGMPVLNGDEFLKEAILSVLSQTYQNWELVISNNSSTDKTEEIIENICNKDSRVRIFKQENRLSGKENFRFVLDASSGNLFTWLAHDDYLHKDYMSQCVDVFQNYVSAACVAPSFLILDEITGKSYEEHLISLQPEVPWLIRARNFYAYPIDNSYLAIYGTYKVDTLRDALLSTPNFPLAWAIEIPFLSRVANQGEILTTAMLGRTYRRHSSSIYHQEHARLSLKPFIYEKAIRFAHIFRIRLDAILVLSKNKFFNPKEKIIMLLNILSTEVLEQLEAAARNLGLVAARVIRKVKP